MKIIAPLIALSACLLLIVQTLPGQQTAPRKQLTPEQQQFQRKWRDYMARRPGLQGRAKQIFDAEMAREKAGDCPTATTTYEINMCMGKEVGTTDQNLRSYETIIRDLIASAPDELGGPPNGPEGQALTSAESAEEFDRVEQAWRQYRTIACKAARDQFGGGSGAPSFEMECQVALDRSHMRELYLVYGGELRL